MKQKKQITELIQSEWFAWLNILIISIVMCLIYTHSGLSGDMSDGRYHLQRVEGVRKLLMTGKYPGGVYPNFCNGYGYGSGLFYPDVFLVIPALIRMVGFQPIAAYKLYVFFLTLVAGFTTYYSYRYITKNKTAALCSTYILCLSHFYIADLLLRVGLNEYIAFIFMPIAMAGLFDLLWGEFKKPWLLGIGFAGILLSHTIMFFLAVCLAVVMVLIRARVFLREPKRFLKLVLTALAAMLCTCFYWLPMLEQMHELDLLVNYPWTTVGDNMQNVADWFLGWYTGKGVSGRIGFPILLFLLFRLCYWKKYRKMADVSLITGVVLLLMTTSLVPWKLLSGTVFNNLQFTWRLYPYALFFAALGLGIVLAESNLAGQRTVQLAVAGICIVYALFSIRSFEINPDSLVIDEKYLAENSFTMGRNEWLIVGTQYELCTSPLEIMDASGKSFPITEKEGTTIAFHIGDNPSEYYTIPLLYYKGYAAMITSEDGVKTKLPVVPGWNKQVRVNNTELLSGEVTVEFAGSTIRQACGWVNLIAFVALLAGGIIRNRKKIKMES